MEMFANGITLLDYTELYSELPWVGEKQLNVTQMGLERDVTVTSRSGTTLIITEMEEAKFLAFLNKDVHVTGWYYKTDSKYPNSMSFRADRLV